jgi:hypothetical protein
MLLLKYAVKDLETENIININLIIIKPVHVDLYRADYDYLTKYILYY